MVQTSLQPLRFWVEDLSILSNRDYVPSVAIESPPAIQINLSLDEGINAQGIPLFRCLIQAETTPGHPESAIPYVIAITAVGIFAFHPGHAEDRESMRSAVAFNGSAMLYGFIRDTVLHQTGIGAHGPFMLPAVNLVDAAKKIAEVPSDEAGIPMTSTSPSRKPSRRSSVTKRPKSTARPVDDNDERTPG